MLIKAVQRSLSLRSGLTLLVGAVLLTVALSGFFYPYIYTDEMDWAQRQLRQLVATVEKSAAVAAYLDDQELATEVVKGLASNDIVAAAALQTVAGMQVVAGNLEHFDTAGLNRFPLESPFMAGETIGHLILQPNNNLIEANARTAAMIYVGTLAAHSLLLTLFGIAILHLRLARPLSALAKRVHAIEPGSSHRLPLSADHHHDELGQLVGDINTLLEATQLTLDGERRLRQYVESVEKRFRLIFDHASCGIALLDAEGKILLGNPSFQQLLELDPNATSVQFFTHQFDDASLVQQLLQQAVTGHSPVTRDLLLSGTRAASARWLHALLSSVQDGEGQTLVECILYDVSERARRELQIRQEAELDPLTQLYNRRAGERLLHDNLEQLRFSSELCALLLIDLDRFKPINDTWGHDAGDKVLVTIAQRLTQSLRRNDVIIRWGGDEFVALLSPCRDLDAINQVASKLLHQIGQPIDLGNGHSDHVGASIGMAVFPLHGQQLDDLIAKADRAMYQAKEAGRNQICLYQPNPPAELRRKA